MALGDLVVVKDKVSPSRFNAKTITWTDATTLSNIPTTPCMVVIPTTTGSGFVKNIPRFRDADNQSWLNLGMVAHTHNAETDLAGGSAYNIAMSNIGDFVDENQMLMSAGRWASKFSAGSSVADELTVNGMSKFRLLTAAAINAYAMAMMYGVTTDFGFASRMQQILHFLEDTSILARIGVNAEDVNIANIVTTKKYGLEVCDNAVEGKFFLIFSCDGVSRTTTGSAYPIVAGARQGYSLLHTPNVNIKLTVNEDDANAVKKPAQIPSSGNAVQDPTDTGALIKAGVLAKAAAARNMKIGAFRYIAKVNDTKWGQSPLNSS
jgi:hypothetical protein